MRRSLWDTGQSSNVSDSKDCKHQAWLFLPHSARAVPRAVGTRKVKC